MDAGTQSPPAYAHESPAARRRLGCSGRRRYGGWFHCPIADSKILVVQGVIGSAFAFSFIVPCFKATLCFEDDFKA